MTDSLLVIFLKCFENLVYGNKLYFHILKSNYEMHASRMLLNNVSNSETLVKEVMTAAEVLIYVHTFDFNCRVFVTFVIR